MIAAHAFANLDVAVFGLARSGMASVRALKAGGARVFAWDDADAPRKLAAEAGATIAPWSEWPWDRLNSLVLSPGVPLTHPAPHPVVAKAKAAVVEVIGDMEIFAREIGADMLVPGRAPVIAVTAKQYLISTRRQQKRSMSWNCRLTRSISRRDWFPM